MVIRRKKSDDYIGPSTGVMKWVNKLCRFVLFPFIHPLIFVILLAVLGGSVVGIHHFSGVAYKDIPSWVVDFGEKLYKDISSNEGGDFISNVSDKAVSTIKNAVNTDKETSKKVVRAIDRKAFSTNSNVVGKTIEADVVKANDEVKKEEVVIANSGELFEYYKHPELGYVYSKNPRVIKGKILVVDANKIKINGEEMLLYGIYVDPSSETGIKASSYLQKMVKEKEAECRVVAFTQYADLTAICVVNGVNINRKLFNMGLSQNIGIK